MQELAKGESSARKGKSMCRRKKGVSSKDDRKSRKGKEERVGGGKKLQERKLIIFLWLF